MVSSIATTPVGALGKGVPDPSVAMMVTPIERYWLVAHVADVAGRGVVRVDDGITRSQGDLRPGRNHLAGTGGPGTLHPQRRLEAKGVDASLDDLDPNTSGDGLAAAATEGAA